MWINWINESDWESKKIGNLTISYFANGRIKSI